MGRGGCRPPGALRSPGGLPEASPCPFLAATRLLRQRLGIGWAQASQARRLITRSRLHPTGRGHGRGDLCAARGGSGAVTAAPGLGGCAVRLEEVTPCLKDEAEQEGKVLLELPVCFLAPLNPWVEWGKPHEAPSSWGGQCPGGQWWVGVQNGQIHSQQTHLKPAGKHQEPPVPSSPSRSSPRLLPLHFWGRRRAGAAPTGTVQKPPAPLSACR